LNGFPNLSGLTLQKIEHGNFSSTPRFYQFSDSGFNVGENQLGGLDLFDLPCYTARAPYVRVYLLSQILIESAGKHWNGKVVFVFGGSYDIANIIAGTAALLSGWTARDIPRPGDLSSDPAPDASERVEQILKWDQSD
jgi:hypothetical protein